MNKLLITSFKISSNVLGKQDGQNLGSNNGKNGEKDL